MKLVDEMSAFHPQVSWSRIAKTEQPLSFLKDDFQKPLSGVNPSLKEPESHVFIIRKDRAEEDFPNFFT